MNIHMNLYSFKDLLVWLLHNYNIISLKKKNNQEKQLYLKIKIFQWQ